MKICRSISNLFLDENRKRFVITHFYVVIICFILLFVLPLIIVLVEPIQNHNSGLQHHLKVVNDKIMLDSIEVYRFIPVEGGNAEIGGSPALFLRAVGDNQFGLEKKTISSFLIGTTPVTIDLWNYVDSQMYPDFTKRGEGDGVYVGEQSYEDWMMFIHKLNVMTGRTFRLPNNDEWEYAARGGINSKGYQYAGSNNIDEVAFFYDTVTPLTIFKYGKNKKPNELGLYDMSGGVWEITSSSLIDVDRTARKTAHLYKYGLIEFDNSTTVQADSIISSFSRHISKGGSANSTVEECAIQSSPQVIDYTGARLILEY